MVKKKMLVIACTLIIICAFVWVAYYMLKGSLGSTKYLKLNYMNGSQVEFMINSKTKYSDLPVNNREGYTFVGWAINEDGTIMDINSVIGNVDSLFAIYTKNSYIVTIDLKGGSIDNSSVNITYSVLYEDTIELKTPTKKGYTFTSWSNNSLKATLNDNKLTVGSEDVLLTANYKANRHIVSIDYAGGKYNNKSNDFKKLYYDESFTLHTPTRDGYIFSGYDISGGSIINGKFVLTVDSDVTIKAKWIVNNTGTEVNNKEVIIPNPNKPDIIPIDNKDDGKTGNENQELKPEEPKPEEPKPEEPQPVEPEPEEPEEPEVEEKESTISTYVVYYYLMTSDGKNYVLDKSETKTFDASVGVTVPVIPYDNYISPEEYKIEKSDVIKTYEVVYKYNRKKFKLTFDNKDYSYYFGQRIELKSESKEGYYISGYDYSAGSITNEYYEMPACDAVVNTKYVPIEYTITYVLNGGTLDNMKETYTILDDFYIDEPYKDGYNFDGWVIDKKTTVKEYRVYNRTGNIVLVASFTPKTVIVTFVYRNGTPNKEVEDQYNTRLGKLEDAKYEGHTFLGRYYDKGTKVSADYIVLKSMYLTARYDGVKSSNNAVFKIESLEDGVQLVRDNTKDYNLRYVGSNPNNYVTFNGEKWRIIGVMYNVKDSNGTKPKLKLIKDDYLIYNSYDVSDSNTNMGYGINDWSNSTLNKMLNDSYYNSSSITCKREVTEGETTKEEEYECGFVNTGLEDESKALISDATYNLGTNGVESWVGATPNKFYEYEKGNSSSKVCSESAMCNDTVERKNTWQGKIALMNVSDYGFAVGGNSRNTCLNKAMYRWWDTSSCLKDNWLNKDNELTINAAGSKVYAYRVFTVGNDMGSVAAYNSHNIRPVIYLDSEVTIESGNGTDKDPYVLGKGW